MKTLTLILVAVLGITTASAQVYGGMGRFSAMSGQEKSWITIRADGTVLVSSEVVMTRKMAEQMTRLVDRLQRMEDDEEADTDEADNKAAAAKPVTDQELAERFRKLIKLSEERSSDGEAPGLASLDIDKDSVRMVTTNSHATVRDLLAKGRASQMLQAVYLENIRFETNAAGKLQITLKPSSMNKRAQTAMTQMMQNQKGTNEWRLVLPGSILSSSLPGQKGNETWIQLAGGDKASVDAVMNTIATNMVIVAEPGGLKLSEALDSRKLMRSRFRPAGAPGSSLPLTEAGPGYNAEAGHVTITTVHFFPEGTNMMQGRDFAQLEKAGVTVSAKLFPPEGRTILSMNSQKVTKAVDDRLRPIPMPGKKTGDDENEDEDLNNLGSFTTFSGNKESGAVELNFEFGLPSSDARAIEALEADVVVISAGTWKELVPTNLQEIINKPMDASSLVPGATFTVVSITNRQSSQLEMTVKFEGPAEVAQIRIESKDARASGMNVHSYDMQSRTVGNKTVRQVQVTGYNFSDRESSLTADGLNLVMRYPNDLRRERVKIKLNAIDLF
jgi:hypothetical protein